MRDCVPRAQAPQRAPTPLIVSLLHLHNLLPSGDDNGFRGAAGRGCHLGCVAHDLPISHVSKSFVKRWQLETFSFCGKAYGFYMQAIGPATRRCSEPTDHGSLWESRRWPNSSRWSAADGVLAKSALAAGLRDPDVFDGVARPRGSGFVSMIACRLMHNNSQLCLCHACSRRNEGSKVADTK